MKLICLPVKIKRKKSDIHQHFYQWKTWKKLQRKKCVTVSKNWWRYERNKERKKEEKVKEKWNYVDKKWMTETLGSKEMRDFCDEKKSDSLRAKWFR